MLLPRRHFTAISVDLEIHQRGFSNARQRPDAYQCSRCDSAWQIKATTHHSLIATMSSSGACQYCLSLQGGKYSNQVEWIKHSAWVNALMSSACTTCKVLRECIKIHNPVLLEGPWPPTGGTTTLSVEQSGTIWVQLNHDMIAPFDQHIFAHFDLTPTNGAFIMMWSICRIRSKLHWRLISQSRGSH
jgi:hypothetical protein